MQTTNGGPIFNYWTLQSITNSTDITSEVNAVLAGDTFTIDSVNTSSQVFNPSTMYTITFNKALLKATCQLVELINGTYDNVTQVLKTSPTNCGQDYRVELQITDAKGNAPASLFAGDFLPTFQFYVQQNATLQYNSNVTGTDKYFPYLLDLNNSDTHTNNYTAVWSVNMDPVNNSYYDTTDINKEFSFIQVEQLSWDLGAPRDPLLSYINPTATVNGTQVTSYVPYMSNDQFWLNVSLADPEGVILPPSLDENFTMSYALAQQYNHVSFAPQLSDVLNYSAPVGMDLGGSFTTHVTPSQIQAALAEGSLPQDILYALPQVASYNSATGATEQKLDLYFHYNLATALAAQNLTVADLSCLNLTAFAQVFYDENAFSWPAGTGVAQLMVYNNATGAWATLTNNLNVPAASLDPNTIGIAMAGESNLSPFTFTITPVSAAPLYLSQLLDSNGNLLFKLEADVQGTLAGQTWLAPYESDAAIVGAVGLVSANFTAWSAPVVTTIPYSYTNHSGRVHMLNYVPGNYTIDLSYVGTNPGYMRPAAESLAWQLLPRPVNLAYTLPQGAVAGQPAQVALSATDTLTGIAAADCKAAVSAFDLDTSTTTLLGTVITDDTGQATLVTTYPAGNFTFQFAVVPNDGAGQPPYVNTEWTGDFYAPANWTSASLAVPYNQATMVPRFLGVARDNTFVAGSEVDLLVQFYQQGGAVVPDVNVDVYVNGQFYATVNTFNAVTLNLPNPAPYNVTVVFPLGNAWYPQLENTTILTGRRAQVSITAISPPSAIPPNTTVAVTATVTDLTAAQAPIPGAGVNFIVENTTSGATLWNGTSFTASDGTATAYIPWNATFIQDQNTQIVVYAEVVPNYPTLDAATSSQMLLDYICYATYIDLRENLTAYYVQSTDNFNLTLTSESGAALGEQPVQVEVFYDGSGSQHVLETIASLTTEPDGVANFTWAFAYTGTYEFVLAYNGSQSLEQAAATADWTFDVQERPVSLQCSIAPQNYYVGNNATLQFSIVDALTNSSLAGQVIHVMEQVEETGDLRFFDILTGTNDTLLWEPLRAGHFNFTLAFPDGGVYQPATLSFELAPMLRSLSYNCSLGNLAAVSVYDTVPVNITVADALNGSAPAGPLQVELDIYSLGHSYSYSSAVSPAGVASFSYTVPYAAAHSSITFTINVTDCRPIPHL